MHEKDNFLGNSGHILGYANLSYEKAIMPKWAGRNTSFPIKNLPAGNRIKNIIQRGHTHNKAISRVGHVYFIFVPHHNTIKEFRFLF